jgi:hypothetical protein
MEIADDLEVAALACPAERLTVARVKLDAVATKIADDLEVGRLRMPGRETHRRAR